MDAGLWQKRAASWEEVHCWRPRRSAFGELVQWDTSEHDWLEGRGPVRYLVRLIDDATSWSWGRFVERDATSWNMGVLWEYLEQQGRMLDVYTDRDSMFAIPVRNGESPPERVQADRLTQIGRALRELGIGWIAAYSAQAKGRIERSFLTAQDRLHQAPAVGQGFHPGIGQCLSGERVLAGVEHAFRAAGGALSQSASNADTVPRSGCDSVSRRRARDRQRLHVFLREPALPDRASGHASGHAPPAAAGRSPAGR